MFLTKGFAQSLHVDVVSTLSSPDLGDLVDLELLEEILLFGDLIKPSNPGEIVISYDAFFLLSNIGTDLRNL